MKTKPLSETYKELGIAFRFPIRIKDTDGNRTYFEDSDGYWRKSEYDTDGNMTYFEDSDGYWRRKEYDAAGNRTYSESSEGYWIKAEYDADGNRTYFEYFDTSDSSESYKEGHLQSQSITK